MVALSVPLHRRSVLVWTIQDRFSVIVGEGAVATERGIVSRGGLVPDESGGAERRPCATALSRRAPCLTSDLTFGTLRAHGSASFCLQSSDRRPGGPKAISYQMTFKAEAATSKALRAGPDNDTLRALCSLDKRGSLGDATGAHPGVMDVRRLAKFDAGTRAKARHASKPWPAT